MQQPADKSSRKKFLWWGAAAFASIAALKFFAKSKTSKKETVKMLAQDGSLVEIDKTLLSGGKKISDAELKVWVNNK